jgi:hypothetical protein
MLARFDHHPMLTALLASAPASSPSSVSDGGNAGKAAPGVKDYPNYRP